MKKKFIKSSTVSIILLLVFSLLTVGCGPANTDNHPPVDKTALNAELALEITEQGDYTLESFNAYSAKLASAKSVCLDPSATQQTLDAITEELKSARLALTVRPVLEVLNADKKIELEIGEEKEILLSDYVNTNRLSRITYEIDKDSTALVLGEISDGRFTVTAGEVEETTAAKLTLTVLYDGAEKLTVEISVGIVKAAEAPDQPDIPDVPDVPDQPDEPTVADPTLILSEVREEYDLYELTDKSGILIDFSENIINEDNYQLTYSAVYGGEALVLDGALYRFDFSSYIDSIRYEVFTVTVSYIKNGEERSLEYIYKLAMKDTTAYRMYNGGFEDGLLGWNKVGNIGEVSSDHVYWVNDPERAEGYEFGIEGEKMFSAYAPGAFESAVGVLTSPVFKVGGSGFISFKVGAMKDGNYVYIDVVDSETKEILARYYNGLWAERTEDVKSGCTLVSYKADLSAFMGREVFFRISDNADSGYGLFFLDGFVTYYEEEPTEFNIATPVNYGISGTVYDLFNGGFELGDVQGWWNIGDAGAVTDADSFFSGALYGKDGAYLYSGVEDYRAGNGREGNKGTLTSSVFEIGGSGYITYMLGGGNSLCYVQIIDSTTGEILARYRQQAREDAVLKTYVADLTAYIGRSVRIQLVDNATYDWGCVSFDNVVTYYKTVPQGIKAIDVRHELVNGSFESGLDGWTVNITESGTHNSLGWVQDTEHDAEWYAKNTFNKDGNNLFTFVKPDGTNCENSKGALVSSTFVLKKDTYISFMFGGAGRSANRDVYIELCLADGTVIATFYNEGDGKVHTLMNNYCYKYEGEDAECFFRVVDDSVSDYGCFVVDGFRVNLKDRPDGYFDAVLKSAE